MFAVGFRAALFPKSDTADEVKKQAASLFRLLSVTSVISGIIMTLIPSMNMLYFMDWTDPQVLYNLPLNIAVTLTPFLYCLFLIVFIFEPIVYILRKKI